MSSATWVGVLAFGESFEGVLEAARRGAEWAWAQLYREYAGPVTGYLTSRGATEPEDIASDVFLQVARKLNEFTGDESAFRSWLFVITHRRLIDERRVLARRPKVIELPADPSIAELGNVESEAMDQLVTGELLEAFDRLTDGQREVLALRIIGGLTLAETAHVLEKGISAVKATQRRALLAMKDLLSGQRVTQ